MLLFTMKRAVVVPCVMALVAFALAGCESVPKAVQDAVNEVTKRLPPPTAHGPSPQDPTNPAPSAPPQPSPEAPASQPYLAHPTPAESTLKKQSVDYNRLMMGGVVDALIKEGAAAAALCQVRHMLDDKGARARNQCIAAALVITSVVGAHRGYSVAVRNEAKNDRLARAHKVTADLAADNERLQGIVDTSATMLQETRARLIQLNADIRAKRIAKEALDQERRSNQANAEAIAERVIVAKQARDEYQKAIASLAFNAAERRGVDEQMKAMNQRIATLEAREKQLREVMAPIAL